MRRLRVGGRDHRDEIRQRQAAPRRAQHREPREAIGGLDQRVRQRNQIENGLAFGQRVELDGRVGNVGLAQCRKYAIEMSARADEHGNRPVAGAERGMNQRDDAVRFAGIVRHDLQRPARARRSVIAGDRGRESDRASPRVAAAGEDAREHVVDPRDQSGVRAEVPREDEALDRNARHLLLRLGFDEDAHLGFAKAIDRLHRVADGEQGVPVTGLPSRGEQTQKLELCERCVLEFVDQQMIDPKIEREQQVGRPFLAAEGGERAQHALREVERAGIAKGEG